ncbi:MAG TPA: hypothetical protein PLR06_07650, partial [Cyclobacteriaceae bacterium]|nr:hypothetical protein [Cyclobacteriaceae bacterium]
MSKLQSAGHQQSFGWLPVLQAIVLVGMILYFGSSLFIPLAFALLISFILYPPCLWFERHGVGRGTAIAICIGGLTILCLGIAALLASQVFVFLKEWT